MILSSGLYLYISNIFAGFGVIKRMLQQCITPESVGFCSNRLSKIAPRMQAFIDEGKLAGISTMVARHGEIIHSEQVGYAEIESNKVLTEDAIFRIYSMTKPIISVALMILFEDGVIRLFDPVAKFLPAFKNMTVLQLTPSAGRKHVPVDRPITVRDLLTHTSGLTYDFLDDSPVCTLYRQAKLMHDSGRTLQDMVQELARLPLAFQPGACWKYSLGIDVAAHLIEVISGLSIRSFLQERIFNPLGMVDTDFQVPTDKMHRLVAMYGHADIAASNMTLDKMIELWGTTPSQKIDVSKSYPANKPSVFSRGGHGLFSTSKDYMCFSQMLLNQGELNGYRLLSRKTINLMFMNHLTPDLLPLMMGNIPVPGYGFGLGSRVLVDVAQTQMSGSVGEFGWAGAAKTYYWVDPVENIIGLFMG